MLGVFIEQISQGRSEWQEGEGALGWNGFLFDLFLFDSRVKKQAKSRWPIWQREGKREAWMSVQTPQKVCALGN